jgi:hypothetical protein
MVHYIYSNMSNINATFEKHIAKFLDELAPRARSVLKRRYGVGGTNPMTLEAIGNKEGITRERVRQIENDAMKRLRKSASFGMLAAYEKEIVDLLNQQGGMAAEEVFLACEEFKPVKDKNSLILFFDLSPSLSKRKIDEAFHLRWHTREAPHDMIESALTSFSNDLKSSNTTLSEAGAHEKYQTYAKKVGIDDLRASVIRTHLALSKNIEKNAWGEYGHISSPFVRPRGMRESSFVVLSRANEPLHFREIAKRIEAFAGRRVHIQTVHNELIKDKRFVLVGRGLYALGEWGYEPGFVKDVLVRLLKNNGPMNRDDILKHVSRLRKVKSSTVFINLQNKKLFKPLDNGTFTITS